MIAETQPDYPPAKYIDIILTNGYNKHNAVVHAMGSLQISLPIGAKEVEFEVRNLFVGKGEYVKVKMAVQR